MIRVESSRKEYQVICDGCKDAIKANAPTYSIMLGCDKDGYENIISLCEDCGSHLQNDMSDEYSRFVDLELPNLLKRDSKVKI